MPQQIIKTIPRVIEELRGLSSQIVHPKDVYFASMAQTVENFVAIAEHKESVIDDLVSRCDRYEKVLRLIAAMGDTGSDEFRQRFDAESFTGWQVAQAMRESALDCIGMLPTAPAGDRVWPLDGDKPAKASEGAL